ncbi:uncharacterized protein LOC130442029 [Diorhabda sublineata]|uniref:uncharacterized protein LOC130442029 n=1 Tax=Diorhabda sublineata TaxID=1163346 RepID=UPI0024E0C497|nr:uncharacterized protein LOC130442029 [Diorhabda sublineata]
MKGTLVFVAICGYLCCVAALPATSQVDRDVEFVQSKEKPGDQPIIDTGYGFDGPFSNPFGGFLDGFESLMAQVRQQVESLWNQFPVIRAGNSSDQIPSFSSFNAFGGFPQIDDLDLGKGNTTSETKIIDGHKVIINQTEYHKDSENGSAFFKVRVIDVQPTEKDSEEVTSTVSPIKDTESLENSVENEIQKNNEAIFYQPLDHPLHLDSASQLFRPNFVYRIDNSEWNDLNQVEPIEDNSISFAGKPVDLSRDTYVNDILEKNGATMNPDAEIIEIVPQGSGRSPFSNRFQNPR